MGAVARVKCVDYSIINRMALAFRDLQHRQQQYESSACLEKRGRSPSNMHNCSTRACKVLPVFSMLVVLFPEGVLPRGSCVCEKSIAIFRKTFHNSSLAFGGAYALHGRNLSPPSFLRCVCQSATVVRFCCLGFGGSEVCAAEAIAYIRLVLAYFPFEQFHGFFLDV